MRAVRHCPTFCWISFSLIRFIILFGGGTRKDGLQRHLVGLGKWHGLLALRNSKKDIMNDGIPLKLLQKRVFLDLKFGRIPFLISTVAANPPL